ncbi:MAG: WG repeat-containing protein [Saprospiraceae bacterium]|nr:WG repeat-containing protein [Saprospiraceae bacterium]
MKCKVGHFICIHMFGFLFSNCRSPQFHIAAQYDEVKPFHQGIAAVRMGSAWGFIDTSGTWVLTPRFAQAEWTEGKPYQVEDASSQVFEIRKLPGGNTWSVVPRPPENRPIETPSGTRYIFEDNEKFGLKDAQGHVLAPPIYTSIRHLGVHLLAARFPEKGECLLNADGKMLSGYFQEIGETAQYGRIRFRHNDRYGLLALDGQVMVQPTLWRLEIAGHHIACSGGGKLQLCTDRLEKLSDLEFDEVLYLDAQHWLAKTTDLGQATLFEVSGRVVKPDVHLSDGKMVLGRFPAGDTRRNKWGYINSVGEEVIPFVFEYTETFWPGGKAVFFDRDPEGRIRKGLLDTTGKIVLPAAFEDIFRHPDGVYTMVQGETFQLLNETLQPLTKQMKKPAEYIGHGVYAQYSAKTSLGFRKSNWYTGEKGGFYRSREAVVRAVYALDGSLLVEGKEWAADDPVPVVKEGFGSAKKNGKWGFVRCKK